MEVHISMPLAATPSQELRSNQDAKREVSQGQPSEQDTLIEKWERTQHLMLYRLKHKAFYVTYNYSWEVPFAIAVALGT